MLVHAETLELSPGVERLLPHDGFKTELFSCLVETNTPVCASAAEAHAELVRLRGELADAAAAEGLAVLAAGTHPFSAPEEQPIVEEPRYVKLLAELGAKTKRQLVCGLHVHVGMESFATCLRTLAAIAPWLPGVLGASVNSPYDRGEEAGVLSARAARLLELPRAGPPPQLDSPEDWDREIAATGADYTRTWWDARPHPRLGTLEVRIADQPTSVGRSAALAALVQALCVAAPAPAVPLPAERYLQARAAAARGEGAVDELLTLVEPAARELGTWELVATLEGPSEALGQLETGRRDGVVAVAADLTARS